MKMNKLFFCFVAASMILSTGKATASTIDYTLTSAPGSATPLTISFALSSQPGSNLPCAFYQSCFSVSDVSFTLNGTTFSGGTVDFYDSSPGPDGGLVIQYAGGAVLVNQGGAVLSPGVYQTLYTGTLSDPTLLNFSNLTLYGYGYFGPQVDEDFILNASATPEPGSIVLLGSGLLALAGAMRWRKNRVRGQAVCAAGMS